MRSFSKKLAFVLAAAMVFTSFAPAAKAEAAKEMTINKSSQILYVTDGNGINDAAQVGGGKGNVSEYDFYVKNKPSDWKKTLKFEWTSSNDEVATVNKSGLTTAVAVGKATISCKITDKDGDVVTTAKTKVTVKANAADVEIKNASKISGTVLELKDGKATLDLDRVMYDANGNKATSRTKGCVTDYTEWLYEPKTGVDVNQSKGVFTFTAPGEYKLYCRTYQSSKYTKTTAESDPVVVTVVDKTIEVKQTTSTKFNIYFAQPASNLSKTDVKVTEHVTLTGGSKTPVDYKVKDFKLADDKMSAEVEVFFKFIHEGEYDVAVSGYDTHTFTASVGEPKEVEVYVGKPDNYAVSVGTVTELKCKLIDAKGVDVTSEYAESADKAKYVRYFIKYGDSYEIEDTSIYFNQVGENATVVAEYHPNNTFDANGIEQGVIKSAVTKFHGVNPNALSVVAIKDWGLSNNQKYTILRDSNNPNETFVPDTLSVQLQFSNGKDAWFSSYDQSIYIDNQYVGYLNFTGLNGDVLDVYETAAVSGNVAVYGRQVGTAPVMVSYIVNVNGEDKELPIGTVNVEVKPKRVMSSVGYKSKNITVSALPADSAADNTDAVEGMILELEVKDQYYTAYNNFVILDWDYTSTIAERATRVENLSTNPNLTDTRLHHGVAVDMSDLENIQINNRQMEGLLWDLNNDLKADATQPAGNVSFGYRVRIKDLATGKILTATFSVDARGHIGDTDHDNLKNHGIQVVVGTAALGSCGNNVARHEDTNGWSDGQNWAAQRTLTFKVYETCNGAKYDEVAVDPLYDKLTTLSGLATGDYYFKILRNGIDVTGKADAQEFVKTGRNQSRRTEDVMNVADVDGNVEKGTQVDYNLTFEGVGKEVYNNDRKIVYYSLDEETIGAATYSFVLYRATSTTTVERIKTETVSAHFNPGAYSFVNRDSIYADSDDQADLIKCFTIADRDGVTYDKHAVGANTVWFGDKERDYKVVRNYDKEQYRAGESVYVEKIVFWEEVNWQWVSDGNGGWYQDMDQPTAYAEFVVPINSLIEVK